MYRHSLGQWTGNQPELQREEVQGSVKSNGTHKVRRSGVLRQPNQECLVFLLSFIGYADILRPG